MSSLSPFDIEKVIIRPMVSGDIASVSLMELAIFPDPWPEYAFRDILRDPGWFGLIAEYQSQITAYAIYIIDSGEAQLANIAVDDQFRGKSIAKKLLNCILTVVKESGCRNIFLDVRPSNETAIKFYRSLGFMELYRRENYYYSPVEDAIVMAKTL